MVERLNRREMLRIAGSSAALSVIGASQAVAEEDDLREKAKKRVAEENNVDQSSLEVIEEGYPTWSRISEGRYKPKVRDTASNITYTTLLNLDGTPSQEGFEELSRRDWEEHKNQFGKASKELYEEMQDSDSNEDIPVTIFFKDIDTASIKSNHDIPENLVGSDVREKLRERFIKETNRMVSSQLPKLRSVNGVEVQGGVDGSRQVAARVSPNALQDLSNINRIDRIEKRETEVVSNGADKTGRKTMNSVNITDNWDISSYPVGITEIAHPDDDQYLNYGGQKYSNVGGYHARNSAELLAADHPDVPGIAEGAQIYFADDFSNQDPDQGATLSEKFQWWASNDVCGVSLSANKNSDSGSMASFDITVNELVRKNWVPFVVSTGNDVTNPLPPAAGFNVIGAGLTQHKGTEDWSDDTPYTGQGDQDPQSKHASDSSSDDSYYPLDRPVVSSPAGKADLPDGEQFGGTSAAAPMVAGNIPIMQVLNDNYGKGIRFHSAPELVKSFLIASAQHQAGSDAVEGTGCINTSIIKSIIVGDQFRQHRFDSDHSKKTFTVQLDSGTLRAGLSWLANLDEVSYSSRSEIYADVDFDLHLLDSNGNEVISSTKFDSAMEWFETSISSGEYTFEVQNTDWFSSELGKTIGLAWEVV